MFNNQQDSNIAIIQINDERLQRSVDNFFAKLEAYFPEHKVFALDSIDKGLRERLSDLYKKIGYKTADDMLAAYGYETISGDAVKQLRSFVMYTPGNEPDIIKSKVTNILNRLEEYYPGHIISSGLQNDHKNISKDISGLYQWLGYDSAGEMLAAYGFQYTVSGGRPSSNDYEKIINFLVEKYKDNPKPKNIGELISDNPEYKGAFKSMQNKASELFGMSFKKYLEQLGLLAERTSTVSQDKKESATKTLKVKDKSDDKKTPDSIAISDDKKTDSNNTPTTCVDKDYFIISESDELLAYVGFESDIVLPEGIRRIADNCFSDLVKYNKKINTVVISEGVEEIGLASFDSCTNLKKIILPSTLRVIENVAFSRCESLTEVIIPEGCQEIYHHCFSDCKNLEHIYVPASVIDIGEAAFKTNNPNTIVHTVAGSFAEEFMKYPDFHIDKNGVLVRYLGEEKEIVIPSKVREISNGGFGLAESIVISEGVEKIGEDAFHYCRNLKKVVLPSTLREIGESAFFACEDLNDIVIPEGCKKIGKGAFRCCRLKHIYLPASLEVIEPDAFDDYGNHVIHTVPNSYAAKYVKQNYGKFAKFDNIDADHSKVM